ncbi:MAG: tetratricopeptide repeat protein [Zavarzinella sp.]
MQRQLCSVLFLGAIIALLGADELAPWDWIRQGNAAYQQQQWQQATSAYQRAEPETTDPGLVAFNKAMALYQQQEFREAELHFQRTLADQLIPPQRARVALLNLGCCLLHQASPQNIALFRDAMQCFQTILDTTTPGNSETKELRTDAQHNLVVAKLLYQQALAKLTPQQQKQEQEERTRPKPPEPKPKPKQNETQPKDNTTIPKNGGENNPQPKQQPGKENNPQAQPKETPKTIPGAGRMPVLNDSAAPQQLTDQDADLLLKNAIERIQRERRKHRAGTLDGEHSRVNDW